MSPSSEVPIRSMRDFERRYFPKKWAERVKRDHPGACPDCKAMDWKRVWGFWRCCRCGHDVWDRDR